MIHALPGSTACGLSTGLKTDTRTAPAPYPHPPNLQDLDPLEHFIDYYMSWSVAQQQPDKEGGKG